jgi:hypothetical protein
VSDLSPYNNMVAFSWVFMAVLALAVVEYIRDKKK